MFRKKEGETIQHIHTTKSKFNNLNGSIRLLFRKMEGETIQDMPTRFMAIIDEIFGEMIPIKKAV